MYDMNDPIGFYLCVVAAAGGLITILFPQWFYRNVTPEQVARDRRIIRRSGFVMLPLGLILLALRLLR